MGSVDPAMRYVTLGSSDLKVPIVCLGTMTFGQQNSEEEAFEIMDYALSRGVNWLDTAELYPVPPMQETHARTEVIIGNWMKARSNRDKVLIATKVASCMPGFDRSYIVGARSEPPAETSAQPALSREQILAACDASLRRLQTSYIDLYQIHWPSRYVPLFGGRRYKPESERECVTIDEQVLAMGELIKAGKVKAWGLSNETTFGVCQMCEAAKRLGVPLPVSIQNDFSPFLRTFEGELAEACAPSNYNIGLLSYGVLLGGALSGKYLPGGEAAAAGSTAKGRHALWPGFQARYHAKRAAAATQDLVELAKSKGLTAATLAQAWAASRWYMGSVIIGATSLAQVKENIDACVTQLDQETLDAIDELYSKHGNVTYSD